MILCVIPPGRGWPWTVHDPAEDHSAVEMPHSYEMQGSFSRHQDKRGQQTALDKRGAGKPGYIRLGIPHSPKPDCALEPALQCQEEQRSGPLLALVG